MVPSDVQQLLSPFLPGGIPWEKVTITYEPLLETVASHPRTLATVLTARGRRLRTVGRSLGTSIQLDPDFGDLNTAAGLALLAHELRHQHQIATIPNFSDVYADEEWKTPPNRPWENPYEREAYRTECVAWHALVDAGWPPGDWLPLGVQVGLC